MGVRLICEVLDYAPANLTPSELVVALVIAENANDITREGWPGMDVLTRRSRLKPRAVRDILTRLAARGLDLRVPLGADRNGKPIYAHEGKQTTYRIPRFDVAERPRGGTVVPPRGGTLMPPLTEQRRHEDVQEEAPQRPRGGMTVPPFPSGSSPQSPQAAASAEMIIEEATGATAEEAAAVVDLIRRERSPKNLAGFLRHLGGCGELGEWLGRVRAQQAQVATSAAAGVARMTGACRHGIVGGDALHPQTGLPWFCALCRVAATAERRGVKPSTSDLRVAQAMNLALEYDEEGRKSA